MPFLGSALGYLIAMYIPGWENLVAFDWNDLPMGREFDGKFLKNVKSPPHALPPPTHPRRLYIDRCIITGLDCDSKNIVLTRVLLLEKIEPKLVENGRTS